MCFKQKQLQKEALISLKTIEMHLKYSNFWCIDYLQFVPLYLSVWPSWSDIILIHQPLTVNKACYTFLIENIRQHFIYWSIDIKINVTILNILAIVIIFAYVFWKGWKVSKPSLETFQYRNIKTSASINIS